MSGAHFFLEPFSWLLPTGHTSFNSNLQENRILDFRIWHIRNVNLIHSQNFLEASDQSWNIKLIGSMSKHWDLDTIAPGSWPDTLPVTSLSHLVPPAPYGWEIPFCLAVEHCLGIFQRREISTMGKASRRETSLELRASS